MTRNAHGIAQLTFTITFSIAIVLMLAELAKAQRSDWILGSNGLDSGSQAPEGFYYQNLWSYYHTSGSDGDGTQLYPCSLAAHPSQYVCSHS